MHWRALQKVQAPCLCKQPTTSQTKLLTFYLRRLKWALQFGPESKVIWGTEGKTLSERWKLHTEALCALGRAVFLTFISRANVWWIWVLFTFLLPHESYFKLLTEVLGGRRGLHSTWFSVLISSLLQAFYGMILLPYKLAVDLNIKCTRQNATFSPPWLLTAENFPLCSGDLIAELLLM